METAACCICCSKIQATVCHLCGCELDFYDVQNDFVIHRVPGYGSKHDNDVVRMQFCCSCFDKIVDQCAVSPVKAESVW